MESFLLSSKKWWKVRHLCHYDGTKKQQTTFKDSFNKIASFIVQNKTEKQKSDPLSSNFQQS